MPPVTEGEEVRKGKGTGVAQAVAADGALQLPSETERLCLSNSEEIMFLVQSCKTVTAWEVTPLQEDCNLDKIYRKTVKDLRIAWFETRDEAQTVLGQCDANIVHIKQ